MTFVKYVDNYSGKLLPGNYGKCDRENKCNYLLKPLKGDFQRKYQSISKSRIKDPEKTEPDTYLPHQVLRQTQKNHQRHRNSFIQNLRYNVSYPLDTNDIAETMGMYHLGSLEDRNKMWATFPFINIEGNIAAIQVKLFSKLNHTLQTSFIHSILTQQYQQNNQILPPWLSTYNKNQKKVRCLFGEHLLKSYPENPIGLVEAPKTAIIATLYFGLPHSRDDLVWLAVYNKGSFTLNKLKALKDRKVIVFPDLSPDGQTFKVWKQKSELIARSVPGLDFRFSNFLENISLPSEKEQGLDIADFLIKMDWREFRIPNKIVVN